MPNIKCSECGKEIFSLWDGDGVVECLEGGEVHVCRWGIHTEAESSDYALSERGMDVLRRHHG